MKKTTLKLLTLLLAGVMLLGSFAACNDWSDVIETEGTSSSSEETSSSSESATSGSESRDESDTEESDTEGGNQAPSLEDIDNGLLIGNANSLQNGVNAYFSDGKRTDFVLENQNMTLEYALAAYKEQEITSLKNKEGKSYIESTGDVFVKMTNGYTFYSSESTKAAATNIYRFGYYMYEARFEEQVFGGDLLINNSKNIDINRIKTKNHTKTSKNDDGSLRVMITNTTDPFIEFSNSTFAAEDYNFLQITMKASTTKLASCAFYVWLDDRAHQIAYFTILPDGEYHTYNIDLRQLDNYSGDVTRLRFDFESNLAVNDIFEISEFKLVNGDDCGRPSNLGLNRSFFVYSNKLHHVLQIATDQVATENIALAGMETKIAEDTVAKLIVKDKNGLHETLDGVDWDSAEYVGFDIKDVGVFGYILPNDNRGDKLEVTHADGYYTIIQSRTPENNTILPSAYYDSKLGQYIPLEGLDKENSNGNDFFMGQRIYTDDNHDFEKFLHEAHIERNPLTSKNFLVPKNGGSYEATFTCPNCGFITVDAMLVCTQCYEEVTFLVEENIYFIGYDPLRGIYQFRVPEFNFSEAYFKFPNEHIDLTFRVTGDNYDRDIYVMSLGTGIGCLESAVLLDENKMLLPVPIEVGKNYSEGGGERNLWNIVDYQYSEAIFPMVIKAKSQDTYSLLNIYQNWGQHPLKQVSWIQFYAPYYHLSTGVTETNCIVPYYTTRNSRGLGTLPDHRAMSAPFHAGEPQHTSGGSHSWLQYTDKNGVYSATENTIDYIDSYGPIYSDVYMEYLSDDGNIKVSYVHTEFPQTDENRAYYEMTYEVLGDVGFKDFSEDFWFYKVGDNDPKGTYKNVGYLNENNECVIVDAAKGKESFEYKLGTECPYFSFFNMPDYDKEAIHNEGYVNLSFLVYNYKFIIGGKEVTPNFIIINEDDQIRISLDLTEVELKAGDKFTINCILMPWGSQESVYDSDEIAGDQNVRDVRVNTLLNPLTPTAVENCTVMESVFVPKIRTTNGKDATFTLKGGQNNVAVRIYGFNKLTAPKIQELVDGEWVDYQVSSAYKPDDFGNAHYYDGYSVHYDEDGTFSYAFIVPMDYTDADGRTFRIAADTDFEGWPDKLPEIEVEEIELPLNLYYSASDLYDAMRQSFGRNVEKIILAPDKSYTTVFANGAIEAYFLPFRGNNGKVVTGQYFVMKYRLPDTNVQKYPYIELWSNTENSNTAGSNFATGKGFINDGKWHVLVIDLSSWNKANFQPNDAGEYLAQYLRVDLFNESYGKDNAINIAYMGMHDDLDEIFALNADLNEIMVLKGNKDLKTYDSEGKEIKTPTDPGESAAPVEGFTVLYDAPSLTVKAQNSGGGHSGKTVISSDKKYVTIHHDTDPTRKRTESYFHLFKDNTTVTGQYLVIKYRASKPSGYFQVFASTTASGASNADCFHLGLENKMFQTDGEWHTVVVDISKLVASFTPNDNGEYVATYLRFDLFNFPSATTDEYSVDLAYIGLCDNYEDAISHEENSYFYDGSTAINATTGEVIYQK